MLRLRSADCNVGQVEMARIPRGAERRPNVSLGPLVQIQAVDESRHQTCPYFPRLSRAAQSTSSAPELPRLLLDEVRDIGLTKRQAVHLGFPLECAFVDQLPGSRDILLQRSQSEAWLLRDS